MQDLENLDFNFESDDEVGDVYQGAQPVETKPLVENVKEDVYKEDLDPMQALVVQIIMGGLKQANEKGIYPDKVIQQALTLLKNHKIDLGTREADAMTAMLTSFHAGDRNKAKARKQASLKKERLN